MDFRILGPTEALDAARRIVLPTGRGRSLLALLILHAGEPVASERIVDELWGDYPPRTAATVVQGLVSRLRRSLDPERAKGESSELLQTVGSGYRLAVAPESVDANRFKRLLDSARYSAAEVRSATLADALSLWRGPALADFTYEPFAQRAIAALEELKVQATEDRIEAELSLRRGGDLVAELEEVIAANPFRERPRELLMLALYRAGRRADALAAYRQARSLFAEELGLEPGPALRELEAAIFRQDAALELAVPRAVEPSAKTPASWLPRERRMVAVIAVDVAPAGEVTSDPEALGRQGAEAGRVATEALERHGARVERLLGDMLIAFFGFPLAHEDDALRAVRAALEARSAVYALDADTDRFAGRRNRLRAGIEMGEILVTGPAGALRDVVSGPVLAAAARLLQVAGDGEVVVGAAVGRVLRGTLILKPFEQSADDGSHPAGRVLEIVDGASGVPRSFEAPMFGRQQELTLVRSAFRRMLRSVAPVHILVLGDAGIGKSRLVRELAASIGDDAGVVTIRCPTDGEGAFLPLRQAMIAAAGLHGWRGLHDLLGGAAGSRPLSRIANAMHLALDPASVPVLLPAVRSLFEELAVDRPLVVVFEDVHWAEPAFLDLVDGLERTMAGRVLLLSVARPDLIERRPEWEGKEAVLLGPLASDDLESLIAERAGSLDAGAKHRIVDVAQGNPLFAEQLLAAYEEGVGDLVPGSLRGLLMTRIDRLGPGERDVLRCATVAGMEVTKDALCALLPDDAGPYVERHLEALHRKRFLERSGSTTFRFCHSLIRLAAYQTLASDDLANLHERLAAWVEQTRSELRDLPADI